MSCEFFDRDEDGEVLDSMPERSATKDKESIIKLQKDYSNKQHNDLSGDDIKVLLVEYQEINNFYRHHDTMAWTMGSILIPLSLGIFALSVQNLKTIPIEAMILTAIISVGLLIIWGAMFQRMSFYTQIRKPRLYEIESLLGMKNHLSFKIYSD